MANTGVKEKYSIVPIDGIYSVKNHTGKCGRKLGPHEKCVGTADNLDAAGLHPFSGKHRTSVEWNYPSKAVPTVGLWLKIDLLLIQLFVVIHCFL